jgi:hypothetical protein
MQYRPHPCCMLYYLRTVPPSPPRSPATEAHKVQRQVADVVQEHHNGADAGVVQSPGPETQRRRHQVVQHHVLVHLRRLLLAPLVLLGVLGALHEPVSLWVVLAGGGSGLHRVLRGGARPEHVQQVLHMGPHFGCVVQQD